MGLSLADAKTIFDSIAQQAKNIYDGFALNAAGYTNNRNTILGGDIDVAADLSGAFRTDISAIFASLFDTRRAALDRHLGGLTAYLLAQDSRVSKELRDYLGWPLTAPCIFQSPVLAGATKMASFEVTGPGAGTFTDGAAVNTTLYGKVWLELEVVNAPVGAANIDVTVIGTKIDGTAQSKVATIPAGSLVGAKVNVGVLGVSADHYVDVTNITIALGTLGDRFEVNSRLERAIAL